MKSNTFRRFKLIVLVFISKDALTVPSTHRQHSLQWVKGTEGEIEGRHRKAILGTHQVWGITLEQGDSDPKENYVSILFSGWVHPSLEAHPGWLLEAEATATTSRSNSCCSQLV